MKQDKLFQLANMRKTNYPIKFEEVTTYADSNTGIGDAPFVELEESKKVIALLQSHLENDKPYLNSKLGVSDRRFYRENTLFLIAPKKDRLESGAPK